MQIGDRPPYWLSFTLAYLAGVGAAWLVLQLAVQPFFAPDLSASAKRKVMILGALAPLAGVAVFQLIFGLVTRRWLGLWFWVVALLLVYASAILTGYLLARGYAASPEAVVIFLGLPFGLGLWALRLTGN